MPSNNHSFISGEESHLPVKDKNKKNVTKFPADHFYKTAMFMKTRFYMLKVIVASTNCPSLN